MCVYSSLSCGKVEYMHISAESMFEIDFQRGQTFFRFKLNFKILKLYLRFQINSNKFSRDRSPREEISKLMNVSPGRRGIERID